MIYEKQLDLIAPPVLRVERVGYFPVSKFEQLKEIEGEVRAGLDIGGTKIQSRKFQARDGKFIRIGEELLNYTSKGGEGFLAKLEQLDRRLLDEGVKLYISNAGSMNGDVLVQSANLKIFLNEFREKYGADFRRLFRSMYCRMSDGLAGINATLVYLHSRRHIQNLTMIYYIVGTGTGGATYACGNIIGMESGHVPIIPELNPYQQKRRCGVWDQEFTCMELVAGGVGIEDIFEQRTGQKISTQEIVKAGKLGENLISNSALVTAHGIIGLGREAGFLADTMNLTIVLSGGVTKSPKYGAIVKSAIEGYLGHVVNFLDTQAISSNICLDGAVYG